MNVDCPDCNGNGRIQDGKDGTIFYGYLCLRCNGSGKLDSKKVNPSEYNLEDNTRHA